MGNLLHRSVSEKPGDEYTLIFREESVSFRSTFRLLVPAYEDDIQNRDINFGEKVDQSQANASMRFTSTCFLKITIIYEQYTMNTKSLY